MRPCGCDLLSVSAGAEQRHYTLYLGGTCVLEMDNDKRIHAMCRKHHDLAGVGLSTAGELGRRSGLAAGSARLDKSDMLLRHCRHFLTSLRLRMQLTQCQGPYSAFNLILKNNLMPARQKDTTIVISASLKSGSLKWVMVIPLYKDTLALPRQPTQSA